MNRGDTAYLMLDYTLNGDPLVEDAYQEIELQLNKQDSFEYVKKLLSENEIRWGTLTYEDGNETKTFTGYYCRLSQEETFKLNEGKVRSQLRIMLNDEVGSSAISDFDLGKCLSVKVLNDSSE